MIPQKAGVRIKNDKRDAVSLARLLRAGELTGIYVPNLENEAVRDLTKAQEDARTAERKAKQRLNSFLLRNDFTCSKKNEVDKVSPQLLFKKHVGITPRPLRGQEAF